MKHLVGKLQSLVTWPWLSTLRLVRSYLNVILIHFNLSKIIERKVYLPEAVFNFIALLGWNPGGEDEIFSREELIKLFDENRLSKSPAALWPEKLDWMSNDYIKNADLETIFEMAKPFLEEAGRLTDKAEN